MDLDENIVVKPETVDDFAKRLINGVQTDYSFRFLKSLWYKEFFINRNLITMEFMALFLQWIQYFLENQSQQVVIEGQESEPAKELF